MSSERITLLSSREIDKMRVAGRLAAELLSYLEPMVKSGVSTLELNDEAERWTQAHGAKSAFLGYGSADNPFPKSICTSINEVICNSPPKKEEILKDGDIINITVAVIVDGYHGKTSRTFFVGEPSSEVRKLVEVSEECLRRGIAAVKPEGRIGDIGAAIQEYAEANGFSVVRDFVGHGICHILHTAPQIPHYGRRGKGKKIKPGMVFTIQPMINQGTWEAVILDDGWTAITKDGKLSAQFEHTVAVTKEGVEILTLINKGIEIESENSSQSIAESLETSDNNSNSDEVNAALGACIRENVDAKFFFDRGKDKYNHKNYQEAIASFDKALDLNRQYVDAYNIRGCAFSELGDYRRAIADYTKAIEINPQYSDAYKNRGNARRKLGDHQGAIADYDKAIELNPEILTSIGFDRTLRIKLNSNQSDAYELLEEYGINYNSSMADIHTKALKALKNLSPEQKEAWKTLRNTEKRLELDLLAFQKDPQVFGEPRHPPSTNAELWALLEEELDDFSEPLPPLTYPSTFLEEED